MDEGAKVRLVRCPKCENVLPELLDVSLYQCGGCGAVLKGKSKGSVEDRSSEVSGDLQEGGVSGEASFVNAPELQMESTDVIKRGRMAFDNSSTSGVPSREFPPESDLNRRGKARIRRGEERFDDDYTSYSQGLGPNRNQGKDYDLNLDRPTYGKGITHPAESLRSGPIPDQWGVINNGPRASYDITMQGRYDNFRYHEEGPSRYKMNSYYQHGDRTRYPSHNLDEIDSMENLENGRAELLRKLDELKDQLSHSYEMTDMTKERVGAAQRMVFPTPPDPYGRHNLAAYVQENLVHRGLDTMRRPRQAGQTGPHDMGDPHLNRMHGFFPYTDTYGTRGPNPYPQRGYPHESLGYDDPYHQDMLHKAPQRLQARYMHQPFHEHFPYEDVNQDLFMLQQHENLFHQPACSCVHCSNKNWNVPSKANLHDRRSRNIPSNPNLYRNNPNPIQSYNSTGSSYPLCSRNSVTLNSSEPDSENDGFHYHCPRKVVVAHKNGRVWRPIAGGAPFIICTNCFGLLKLPKKQISSAKNQQKMKCGVCSSIILFELGNKDGFFVSVSAHEEDGPTEVDEGSSGTVDENVRFWHGGSNNADMNNLSETDKKPKSNESDKLDPVSPISSLSDDEACPKYLPSEKHGSPSTTLPLTKVKSLPESDMSPDNDSNNIVVSRFEKGNKSKRSELDRTISRQDSIKDAAAESEMDVSLTEFSNSCVSHDSVDISKEDHRRVNKSNDSFLAGLIKKSIRDFTKSNQSVGVGGSQIYVNGHLIPDRVAKKAEKLAGTIQPGEYWYDITAGFWGVMGHPCLGIVMPNIEEFNYPMPEKCAAGNTEIFVNGRELYQKDLDLLSRRGLPITKNGSYIVEMSGKVVDVYTREELDGLGKLAPTVERAKHGFGMKVPKFLARMQS